MSRFWLAILFTLCTSMTSAGAQSAELVCAQQTCPDLGDRAVGVWPYCGCKRPPNCPRRNHQYLCRGYAYETGETGVICSCDYAPPSPPTHSKGYCERLQTPDGQSCREDPNYPGSCLCPN